MPGHPMELRSYGALDGMEDMDAEGFTPVGGARKKNKKAQTRGRGQTHPFAKLSQTRTTEAGTPLRVSPARPEAGTPLRRASPPVTKEAATGSSGGARAHSCSPQKRLQATDDGINVGGAGAHSCSPHKRHEATDSVTTEDEDEDEDAVEEAPVEAPAHILGSPTEWSISSHGSFSSAYRMVSWLELELQLSLRVGVTPAGTILLTGADDKAATALAEVAAGRPRGICLLPRERTTTGVMMGFPVGFPLDPLTDRPEVKSAERCSVSLVGGRKAPTRQVRVVFAGQRPAAIDLGSWGRYQVRPFIREPLRCYRCQAFGHHQHQCTNERDTCGVCSGSHPSSSCIARLREGTERPTPQCPNCGDRHHAWNPRCPARPRPRSHGGQESSARPPTATTTRKRRRRRNRRSRRGAATHTPPPITATREETASSEAVLPVTATSRAAASRESATKLTREASTQTEQPPTQAVSRSSQSRNMAVQTTRTVAPTPKTPTASDSESTDYESSSEEDTVTNVDKMVENLRKNNSKEYTDMIFQKWIKHISHR